MPKDFAPVMNVCVAHSWMEELIQVNPGGSGRFFSCTSFSWLAHGCAGHSAGTWLVWEQKCSGGNGRIVCVF